jgi:hypothetical protein
MRFEIRLDVRLGLPEGAFRAGAFDFAGPAILLGRRAAGFLVD